MIEIQEVKSKKQLKEFARFPVELYKDCPYYVPSLRSDEMATFNPKKNFSLSYSKAKGFLCYKDGKLVGRIAGIISDVDNCGDKKLIRFSRFEAIDDIEVFKALLNAVANYGKENGLKTIHGPWGFNDQDREGMLTFGYDARSTYATNYYYPYFAENMKKLGFKDESRWEEFNFKIPDKPYERLDALAEKIKKRNNLIDITETLTIKQIVKKYGDSFYDALNEAYGKLDGYRNIEGKMKENSLAQFATICNINYISILVDESDEVVAFAIVLPSICAPLIKHQGKLFPTGFIGLLKAIKSPKELEMALIGVKDKYRNSGLNAIMVSKIVKNMLINGVEKIESNPMLENNYSILQQWKFAEYDIIKRRQTYQKDIV